MGSFQAKMATNFAAGRYSCAGLDPIANKIPAYLMERHADDQFEAWRKLLYALIMAAAPHAAAFKPNWAFFLSQGPRGLQLLVDICGIIHMNAPKALLILDMKCGDIGNTNHGYVEFAFKICGADAVTVHPYMGSEAMAPFLTDPDRGVFVLCKTSNKGSGELQDLTNAEGEPLYLGVAHKVATLWNEQRNCGLVVGTTHPADIGPIRRLAPSLPLLIPGIGAQGGDLKATVQAAISVKRAGPFIINQSSSFMYASSGADFALAGAQVLVKTNADIASIIAASQPSR